MRLRSFLLLVVALVTVPGMAAAQQAAISLTILEAPSAPVAVRAGASATVNFQVNMRGENFGCAQPATLPVSVAVSGATSRDTASAAGLNFTVDAGAYPAPLPPPVPPGGPAPYNSTQPASVLFRTTSGVESGYTVRLTITANYAGGDVMGCVPQAFPAAASSPASVTINVQPDVTAPPPGTDGNGGTGGTGGTGGADGSDNATDGDDDEGGGIPTPWPLVPLGFVLVAFILRRRRGA